MKNTCLLIEICENAFEKSRLNTLEFAENSELKSIKYKAFSETQIANILIPKNVTFIGYESFSECYNLNVFDFEEKSALEVIEEKAFYNSGIRTLYLPSSVLEIGKKFCYRTPNLDNIIIKDSKVQNIKIEDKILFGKSDLKSDVFNIILFGEKNLKQIKIPKFITFIYESAFSNCNNIKSVSFPKENTLKKIDPFSFSDSFIHKITIPSYITEIGCYSFNKVFS